MARQFELTEIIAPVALLNPAADAAGRTSGYVNIAKIDKFWLVFFIAQGNAATITLTPLQAQDTSGTNSKALIAGAQIWVNSNTGASDQFVKQANATSFTTDAGTNNKIVVFSIMPQDMLDINNTGGAFHTVAAQTGASNAANITSALILPYHRYQQANPPTILT